MEKVIITSYAENKLSELILVLYQKEYFGFIEDAQNYVDNIYNFIETIPKISHKECFKNIHGKYFVRYDNPKSNMQYFITFDKKDNRYLIQDIISPKTKEYLAVIEGNI